MASKPLVIHEEAAAEYESAFDWYFERSLLAASRFAEEFNQATWKISEVPNRWPIHMLGTRKLLFQHFPFAIVYLELPASIQIVAFAHGRRRPGYWQGRLLTVL